MFRHAGRLGIPHVGKEAGTTADKSGTMDSEPTGLSGSGAQGDQEGGSSGVRMTRRALLGGVSTGVAAGAAAWIAPEIFITKPAAGATLSVVPPATGGGVVTGPGSSLTTPSEPKAGTSPGVLSALATTGLDLERDAELGAALVAGGWAMQRWASRQQAQTSHAAPEAHQAGSSETTA